MDEVAQKKLEALRALLEELLTDIRACKTGTVPTGATLGKMERRIKEELVRAKEDRNAGR